jgi:hypothetical protein
MGKASRSKRNRAVRSAKRTRNNTWWYGLIAVVLIAGMAMVVYARANVAPAEGPYIHDASKSATSKENLNSHWHAALGVWDCDHWIGDTPGSGIWNWPASVTTATGAQSPGRVGTNVYAGLHSHNDGIIHMEPATNDEAGKNANVGKYFSFGGWKISSSGYDFLGTKVANGDKCGDKTGTLSWGVAKFNGDVKKKQKLTIKSGNPGSYKLFNDDVVVIAFLPEGKSISDLENPPSVANLPDAANNEGQSTNSTMPPVTTAPSAPATTAKP